MKLEDIDITVEDDTLIIHGRREEEKEIKEEAYYCCERASGEFTRAITLPEGVKPEGIEATYEDGVLAVTIPRVSPPEAKKIKVKVGKGARS